MVPFRPFSARKRNPRTTFTRRDREPSWTEHSWPDGCAAGDERRMGCVALRTLRDGICEMKRLFVRAEHQGLGVGRQLTEALIDLARRRGFSTMRIDTGDLQAEAHALYRSLGFVPIPPYYECSDRLRSVLVFMELALRPPD